MPWITQRELDAIYARLREVENALLRLDNRARLDRIAIAVESLALGQKEAIKYIRRIAGAEPVTGTFTLKVTGETLVQTSQGPITMAKFDILLPPATATDTTKGELTYTIGGSEPATVDTQVGQEALVGLVGNFGDRVTGSFRFFDDETPPNVSDPRTFDIELRDNLAPPQPGEIGIRITEE